MKALFPSSARLLGLVLATRTKNGACRSSPKRFDILAERSTCLQTTDSPSFLRIFRMCRLINHVEKMKRRSPKIRISTPVCRFRRFPHVSGTFPHIWGTFPLSGQSSPFFRFLRCFTILQILVILVRSLEQTMQNCKILMFQ